MRALFLWLLLWSCTCYGATSLVLSTGEYPPYCSERLKYQGLIPHIITRAFAKEGIRVHFDFYPWKRAYRLSEEGVVDGTAHWYESAERRKTHLYSDPILAETYVWFYLKSAPVEWQDYPDLAHRALVAISGYTYNEAFYKAVKSVPLNVQFVTRLRQSFDLILSGRADLTLENLDVGFYSLRQFYPASTVDLFTTHGKPVMRVEGHLLISRKRPDAAELIARFNHGLKALRESGELEQMLLASRSGQYELDKP
ncbi:amino acid ABC transporter substrate-binding protein [Aeromonas diversa CDC 2478-85]|uniref:Amino acid ABC transporter substrate-binding protein n=1 Tax=Aeromonas diversa CDC 2478-85 TaxID=1268237 RepID=N9VPL7_9GAMM|nr:transporter substrate-binding domain-containing protein [Aeromonas diversa]ENY73513.1 amino acid ABC transporter substrate-binding protein [Aeromonas diversa CDC 2478-85]